MTRRIWYVRWARSEAEAVELQAQGWRVAAWNAWDSHQNNYSILLERDHP